jgi:hypothetical protein
MKPCSVKKISTPPPKNSRLMQEPFACAVFNATLFRNAYMVRHVLLYFALLEDYLFVITVSAAWWSASSRFKGRLL